MDQSKSNKPCEPAGGGSVPMPQRTFTVEFIVGIFAIIAVVCGAYLSVGLGDVALFGSDRYTLYAEFDNVSGLKRGASVEVAGVEVGQVEKIDLKDNDSIAKLTLKINNGFFIRDDDQALIRTKGIIGDRYVKISRGSSTKLLDPEMTMSLDTQSVVDIEDLIGKFIHNMDSGKSE